MQKNIFIFMILSAIVGVACQTEGNGGKSDESKEAGKAGNIIKTSMVQEWFPQAGYAGELMAMYETDSLYNLELTVQAGSDNIDPIKTVLGGTAEFGIAAADRIFTANEKGADLIVVGVANFHSPTAFLAKKSDNINTPKDFVGKKVGVLTGTNTELIYQILMKKQGIDRKTIKEVEAPFDLASYISGAYSIRPCFVYDEPLSLEKQGINYTMIKPEDYGINFMGTVYFTTSNMLKEQPEKVQAFVSAIAKGWQFAQANPTKSIDYVKKFDKNIDIARENEALKRALPYFEGKNKQPLMFSEDDFNTMRADLISIGAIKGDNKNPMGNATFIDNYYKAQTQP